MRKKEICGYARSATRSVLSLQESLDRELKGNIKRVKLVERNSLKGRPIFKDGFVYMASYDTGFALDSTGCEIKWKKN